MNRPPDDASACPVPAAPEESVVTTVALTPRPPLADHLAAMRVASAEAGRRPGEYMLLSWYDRDRNFEAPQHASECHRAGAVPGYVDYGIHHGATLRVDIENGRFVFFCRPVDLQN